MQLPSFSFFLLEKMKESEPQISFSKYMKKKRTPLNLYIECNNIHTLFQVYIKKVVNALLVVVVVVVVLSYGCCLEKLTQIKIIKCY